MALLPFSYDMKHRPGNGNVVADTLSQTCAAASSLEELKSIHNSLIHPGVQCFWHFVRSQNMPYSIDEVQRVRSECTTCAIIKSRFFNSPNNILIRSTALFQRLSVAYKGPILISSSGCRYMLTVVDEYSRFAFPCHDCSSQTAIQCLMAIFSIFGLPSFIHADRRSLFMSEFKQFHLRLGIGSSNTTAYNPRGNSQCECYNSIIWNTILLALESQRLPINAWQDILQDVLHSICSLCTTPHEHMFNFERRSSTGTALTVWLCEPGEVLLKQFGGRGKYDPIVEVVELLEANPTHARIRFRDGQEDSVALRHLACFPRSDTPQDSVENILPDVSSANLTSSPDISSTGDKVVNQYPEIHSSQKS